MERSMRILTLLAAAIVSGVLVGCATVPTDPKLIVGRAPPAATLFNRVICSGGDCTVKIEVIGDCQFKVPDLVVLSGIAGRRHAVVWQIMSTDYVFPRAGAGLDPKGSGNFFGTAAGVGTFMGVEVTVTTPGMSHEYGLNIVKRSGAVCPEVDPYMIE
jgi:hypothetical protein